ncbi:polysaccharide export protein [Vibrio hannami]|uniref:polysaccharide biosynthesis/export family protein n=1 Tax=Vibrio hannami TaxID=2717094 RepID=UPI00240F90A6|nr:polysaccharide biosynthesis/export family protein [Vibrio hannami]MDG3087042.1 polysaccharide export protein [Vibrio hannami]
MKKSFINILLTASMATPAYTNASEQNTTNKLQTHNVSSSQSSQMDKVKNTYRLSGGDLVHINVFGEPDLEMDVALSANGVISFPYIGNVQLNNRTPLEVEQEIESRLRGDYLVNPMVTVSIANFRKFFILGEVSAPNGFEYQPGMNVQKAIAMAGGFTDRASRDINIQPSGSRKVLENVELTFPINPGDTIIVEQSFF